MIDTDLAELYGVQTRRLNEQVKRNRSRFPDDFMFQLTANEKKEVVANCDHLKKIKNYRGLPLLITFQVGRWVQKLEVAKCDLKFVGWQAL